MHNKNIIGESKTSEKGNQKGSKLFGSFCISFIVLLTIILLLTSSSISERSITTFPPNQIPTVTLIFEEDEYKIDTSADISEPMVLIPGTVNVASSLPVIVNVNLTIDAKWNSLVAPQIFNITLTSPPDTTEDILVTVQAPLNIVNGTTIFVTVGGTWSYINELTSDIYKDTIPDVEFDVVAYNTSTTQDGGDDGDDKDKDKKDEKSFLPGFEGILVLAAAIIVILIIQDRKRKY